MRWRLKTRMGSSPHSPLSRSPKKTKVAATPRIVFAVEIPATEVMEMVMACHYLDIPDLLDTACKMVAGNISGLKTLQGGSSERINFLHQIAHIRLVPPDVTHHIYSHLSAEELLNVENSELHHSAHTDLGISVILLVFLHLIRRYR